jgi:hypothetical protein
MNRIEGSFEPFSIDSIPKAVRRLPTHPAGLGLGLPKSSETAGSAVGADSSGGEYDIRSAEREYRVDRDNYGFYGLYSSTIFCRC